jgi:hypothetical protein
MKGVRMRTVLRTLKVVLSLAICVLGSATAMAASYDDNASDLSNIQASPTPFTLTLGANSIIGSVGGSNIGGSNQDWIAITVPAGMQITSYVNAAYSGNDVQGFTGFQFGSPFVGNPGTAGPYAGYAHFGTGAQNPSIPTSTVGVDLLPLMANPSVAQGASGFTPPLGPGSYAFLIQQTNSNTAISYEFDINVVPEPTSLCLIGLGGLGLLMSAVARNRRNA